MVRAVESPSGDEMRSETSDRLVTKGQQRGEEVHGRDE